VYAIAVNSWFGPK